jgi:DNA-binding XRE family transcriptional regulator
MLLTDLRFRTNTPLPILRDAKRRYGRYLEGDPLVPFVGSELDRKISARMSPGVWLKTLRNAHGLTQEQLGKKLGSFSGKRISDWESGRRSIPKKVAKALSELTGIPAEHFL